MRQAPVDECVKLCSGTFQRICVDVDAIGELRQALQTQFVFKPQ